MSLPRNLRSGYINEDVEDYLYGLLPQSDEVVAEIEEFAATNDVPIIGPAVARLLSLLVQIAGAKRIFELGSAIGYSTIWLARAAGPDAEVFLYRWRSRKNQTRLRVFRTGRRGLAHPRRNGRRPVNP